MVGALSQGLTLWRVTAKYVGQPFEKLSCMGLIYKFYREECGVMLPETFEELTLDNFADRYEADRPACEDILRRWACAVGDAVSPAEKPQAYDLMIVYSKISGRTIPAIYLGRGQALYSNMERGVEVLPVGRWFKPVILRRLAQ